MTNTTRFSGIKKICYDLIFSVRRFFLKISGIGELIALLKEIRNTTACIAMSEILKAPKYSSELHLARFGFKVHSQADEDGLIHEIFCRIGVGSRTFLEIGSSNGLESNTLYLLRQGWHGVWVDFNEKYKVEAESIFLPYIEGGALRFFCNFVTRENINEIYQSASKGDELALVSIDIDGNDYHIIEKISGLNARLLVIEYNPIFAPPIEWVMDYDPNYQWIIGSDKYSASLKSYEFMMDRMGYRLVGCTINGNNAFFVRKDLVGNHFIGDGSAEFHYESEKFWLTHSYRKAYEYLVR